MISIILQEYHQQLPERDFFFNKRKENERSDLPNQQDFLLNFDQVKEFLNFLKLISKKIYFVLKNKSYLNH
jgi:hypothetical protein